CNRKAMRMQGTDDAIFAIDRVRGWQQLARRLPPQDVTPPWGLQKIGRVGLTALELPDVQWSRETCDICSEVTFEASSIDPQGGFNLVGARKCLLAVNYHHRCTVTSSPRTRSARRHRSCTAGTWVLPCPLR